MHCPPVQFSRQNEIEMSKFRSPRYRPITIMIVHVDCLVSAAGSEKAVWKRTPGHAEGAVRIQVRTKRPSIAYDDRIAVVGAHRRIVSNEKTLFAWRLAPIIAVREERHTEITETFGQCNDIFLKVRLTISAIEIDHLDRRSSCDCHA